MGSESFANAFSRVLEQISKGDIASGIRHENEIIVGWEKCNRVQSRFLSDRFTKRQISSERLRKLRIASKFHRCKPWAREKQEGRNRRVEFVGSGGFMTVRAGDALGTADWTPTTWIVMVAGAKCHPSTFILSNVPTLRRTPVLHSPAA
jgi:hypothetical protein